MVQLNQTDIELQIKELVPDSPLFNSVEFDLNLDLPNADLPKPGSPLKESTSGSDGSPTLDFEELLASNGTKRISSTPKNLRSILVNEIDLA